MYRDKYNHQQQQQQQTSDANYRQPPPPQQQQQSYYQAQQQHYGGQATAPYPPPHQTQQQQPGFPSNTAYVTGGGGGNTNHGGYSATADGAGAGAGPSSTIYPSYAPPLQQQQQHQYHEHHYRNSAPQPAPGAPLPMRHYQQQQQQQQPPDYYNQSMPSSAPVVQMTAAPLPQQHYHNQQQLNYPPAPSQQQQLHLYPHAAAPSAAVAVAVAPPPPVPMHRAVEDPYYQYQQQPPVHGHYIQGQGYNNNNTPPAAAAPAPLPVQHQQLNQLQQQPQQFSRYEKSRTRKDLHSYNNSGSGDGGFGRTRNQEKHRRSGGGGGGSGGNAQKKRQKRNPAATTETSTYHQNDKHHYRSSRSPAPTDSEIRLSLVNEEEHQEDLPTGGATAPATDVENNQYAVHLPAYQLGATLRMDYLEVSRRFERLVMPDDFIEIVRPPKVQVQSLVVLPKSENENSDVALGDEGGSCDGLGLSQVFNLRGALPVHHEICTEKIEEKKKKKHSLSCYDPDPRLISPPPPPPPLPPLIPAAAAASTTPLAATDLPVVYNAKVVLLSGLSDEDQQTVLLDNNQEKNEKTTCPLSDHLSCRLKFIVARAERAGVKSGIFALGGRVDPLLDGNPNPSNTKSDKINGKEEEEERNKALIHAAKRHFLIQTGVDLSPCQRWFKLLEVKYHRLRTVLDTTGTATSNDNDATTTTTNKAGNYFEVSVLFLVDDGHRVVPCQEDWAAAWDTRHTQPRILVNNDNSKGDTHENNEEESKKIDNGGDAIDVDGGEIIKNNIISGNEDECEEGELPETASPVHKPTSRKLSPMPSTPRLLLIGLNNAKLRLKTMSISLDGLLDFNETDTEEATFEMSLFAETMHEMLSRDAGRTIYNALVEKPWEKEKEKACEDQARVLFAFHYFDAGGLGYILTEDLQVIIESLGLHLHHVHVKELCQAAAEASSSSSLPSREKVEYRKLVGGGVDRSNV